MNRWKKLLCNLLALTMMLSVIPMSGLPAFAEDTAVEIPEGYTAIYTAEDLHAIADDPSGDYILMNDIDLAEAGWDGQMEFKGNLEGAGHVIKNMMIELTAESDTDTYVGLFGSNTGNIRNLGVEDSRILVTTGSSYVATYAGNIVGYNGGTIENCYSNGSVTVAVTGASSSMAYAGGIAGENAGTITGCYSVGSVSAESVATNAFAGGITGNSCELSIIENCYNTGSVSGSGGYYSYVGGIAGRTYAAIESCYNTGGVSAAVVENSKYAYAGGITGYNASGSAIKKCYNTGEIYASAATAANGVAAGGIAGTALDGSQIEESYNIGQVTAYSESQFAVAGGIVGDNSCPITTGYNTGNISACSSYEFAVVSAGGIAGDNWDAISDCYNAGDVYAACAYIDASPDVYAGGVAGRNNELISCCYNVDSLVAYSSLDALYGGITADNYGTIDSCYYADLPAVGVEGAISGEVECTIEELKVQETFVGFDFDTVWTFDTENGYLYPVLFGLPHTEPAENTAEFAGGSGTLDQPYLISAKEHLNNVRLYPGAHFRLLNDIYFTESDLAWEPIGSFALPFSGNFDGAGHAIRGLTISVVSDTDAYAGLFGYNNGTIRNLTMTDCSVVLNSYNSAGSAEEVRLYAGGIAAYSDGTIANCVNDCSLVDISSSFNITVYSYAGGIVGFNMGIVESCDNVGNVSLTVDSLGSAYAGGIAGDNGGAIMGCRNGDNVTVTDTNDSAYCNAVIGGISGSNSGLIQDCYNVGAISASDANDPYIGGIVGLETSQVTTCYNAGGLSATGYATIGGIAGYAMGTMTDCYYLNSDSVGAGSGIDTAVACTPEEMSQQETFVGFDFDTVWTMDGDEVYTHPELQGLLNIGGEGGNTGGETGEGGNTDVPEGYVGIYTAEDLDAVRNDLTANYILMNDIDLAGKEWTPIGESARNSFTGVFDGNGYVIQNLTMDITIEANADVGLFGYNSGTICNLGLEGGSLTITCNVADAELYAYAGSIVVANYGTIENCWSSCDVAINNAYCTHAGGLVGYNSGGTISYCDYYGDVTVSYENLEMPTASLYVGSIVGYNGGTIEYSYNSGSVTLSATSSGSMCYAYAGGVAGYNEDNGIIRESGNNGNVSASYISVDDESYAEVGGIAGYSSGTVEENFNHGSVTAESSGDATAGGIVSKNTGTVSGCSNTGAVFAYAEDEALQAIAYAGGVVGNNWGTIEYSDNTGSVSASAPYITHIGGIAGNNGGGCTISNCYNTGDLFTVVPEVGETPFAYVGGIVGDSRGNIRNSYNTGSVSVFLYYIVSAGGIVGYFDSGTIENCYNVGNVSVTDSTAAYIGGIAGRGFGTFTNCYYLDTVSVGLGEGEDTTVKCTADELKQQATFAGFDFDTVWTMDGNEAYPYPELQNVEMVFTKTLSYIAVTTLPNKLEYVEGEEGFDPTGGKVTLYYNDGTSEEIHLTIDMVSGFDNTVLGEQMLTVTYGACTTTFTVAIVSARPFAGSGTAEDPYLIADAKQLNAVRDYLHSYFKLTNDIDLSGMAWEPIDSALEYFTGVLDGDGHVIRNLSVDISGGNEITYAGLFGCNYGTIRNLGVEEGSVKLSCTLEDAPNAVLYAGGIAGYNGGTIENCYYTGSVSAIANQAYFVTAGGIAGSNYGTITDCENSGDVSAEAENADVYAGGIAGSDDYGTIEASSNSGSVSGTTSAFYAYIGGIVGETWQTTVKSCENSGDVTASAEATAYAGGIVGYDGGTITDCDNGVCSVTATSTDGYMYAGGIAGYSDQTISNSTNVGTVSAVSENNTVDAGGIVGKNYGTVEDCENSGSVSATSAYCVYVGGIAGENHDAIRNCTNEGEVQASTTTGAVYAGGIAGDNYNTIENSINSGSVSVIAIQQFEFIYAGGIAGRNDNMITGSSNSGSIYGEASGHVYAGGIAGYTNGTIEKCSNEGGVTANSAESDVHVGGIAGGNGGTITGSSNSGSMYGNAYGEYGYVYAGGITGENYSTIESCENSGALTVFCYASYSYAGGIVGYNSGSEAANCNNSGSVSATSTYGAIHAGGIAGQNYSAISGCYNTGKITASSEDYDAYVGGIAGKNNSTIEACYNTGKVTATAHNSVYAGGIVGENYSTISNCYNIGAVSCFASHEYASVCAGGIVGNNYGTVSSYSTENAGISLYGGVEDEEFGGTISNCYNIGCVYADVYADGYAGGIAGMNGGYVENSYYLDNISVGAGIGNDPAVQCTIEEMKLQETFVGFDFDTVWTMDGDATYLCPELQNVEMAFVKEVSAIVVTTLPNKTEYIVETEDFDPTGGKASLYYNDGTAEQFDLTASMVSGFDNTLLGEQVLTVTYGELTAYLTVEIIPQPILPDFAGGSGTAEDPYLIATPEQLSDIRNFLDAYFLLINDIDLAGVEWVSIGSGSEPFFGVLDGNGYAIKNLVLTVDAGLFGCNEGIIRNLGLMTSSVSAQYTAGGIVCTNYGTIEDCYNAGNVSAQCTAGGIAGENYGLIRNCYNSGSVSASDNAGGIAGYSNGEIQNCYNIGSISASVSAGGIAGQGSNTIQDCYNTGSVDSEKYAGGIVGINSGTVENCYNTGNTSASGDNVYAGGIVGNNQGAIYSCYNIGKISASAVTNACAGGIAGFNNNVIHNCYNVGQISAAGAYLYTGGIVSENAGVIENCYYLDNISAGVGSGDDTAIQCTADELMNPETFIGFDFDTVWTMGGNEYYAYPELQNVAMTGFDGLYKHADGNTYYIVDGKPKTSFLGMYQHSDGQYYYIAWGKFNSMTGLKTISGTTYLLEGGIWQNDYNGLYTYGGKKYYIVSGKVNPYNGLKTVSGEKYLFKSGIVRSDFTGLHKHGDGKSYYIAWGKFNAYNGLKTINGIKYVLKSGVLDTSVNGYYTHADGKDYYVLNGAAVNGLKTAPNGKKYLYDNGLVKTSFMGVHKHSDGKLYYIAWGAFNSMTGLKTMQNGDKYLLKGGIVNTAFTGLHKHGDGKSYYIVEGKFNAYNGLKTINGIKYVLKSGVLDTSVNGYYTHSDGKSYYVLNGVAVNGLKTAPDGKKYLYDNGVVKTSFLGMHKHSDGKYYYIAWGQFNSMTGLKTISGTTYLLKGGIWQNAYNGTYTQGGVTYTIVNGLVA